ncbi:MAG: SRPBCC family protein [Methylacidiphilales bacterium]|nr:SRPBCC family protein [Candidatus Methylacidiphilales bacterium]MDW8349456.1 SRPBCC family protein [Verrucomicrobiae bacterium]
MKIYVLKVSQELPLSLGRAWDFISDPRNLPQITPRDMAFKITSQPPPKIYPGLIITYRVAPLFGIPLTWVTEITHVREPNYFVDEQRFGPYRLWHHEHHLTPITPDKTQMDDIVHYALPFDPFSRIVHPLLVKKRLEEIFNFRREALRRLFSEG